MAYIGITGHFCCLCHRIHTGGEKLLCTGNFQIVNIFAYHNYAGSKYAALGMENTLPPFMPDTDEILKIQRKLNSQNN